MSFKKVALAFATVEAVEVTPNFVYSLETCGVALQRFGEQVEIWHHGPLKKKSYAVVGEYIVRFPDSNGKSEYVVLSAAAYRALFQEATGEAPTSELEQPPLPAEEFTGVALGSDTATTVESASEKAKREKREARMKELKSNDMGVVDAPLQADAE